MFLADRTFQLFRMTSKCVTASKPPPCYECALCRLSSQYLPSRRHVFSAVLDFNFAIFLFLLAFLLFFIICFTYSSHEVRPLYHFTIGFRCKTMTTRSGLYVNAHFGSSSNTAINRATYTCKEFSARTYEKGRFALLHASHWDIILACVCKVHP